MAGTYDEETERLIENRRRNAEIRRAQQAKKRNRTLALLAGIAVLIIVIIIISVSCSSKKSKKEAATTPKAQETTAAQTTSQAEATTEAETTTASNIMYTTDVLNLREEPNAESAIIVQIDPGKKVEILEDNGEWCKVQRGTDTGYLMKEYLSYENTVD